MDSSVGSSKATVTSDVNFIKCMEKTNESLVHLSHLTEKWKELSVEKEQFCTRYQGFVEGFVDFCVN